MASSKEKLLFIGITVIGSIVIIWLVAEHLNKNKIITQLKKEIDSNENLTEQIKNQLKALINNKQIIEPQIAAELSQIIALIEIKQDITAILKLAKIVEDLLKEHYKGDKKELEVIAELSGRKKPVFADYLQHAKNKNLISAEDYHLLSVLKIIRNEEAHELNVKKEKALIFAAFISAIGITLSLCRLLKKKTIVDTASILQ